MLPQAKRIRQYSNEVHFCCLKTIRPREYENIPISTSTV